MTPISAFVILRKEDSKRTLYNKVDVDILGHPCRVHKTKAPTDVVWENQD